MNLLYDTRYKLIKRISLLFFTSTGQISLKGHYRREGKKAKGKTRKSAMNFKLLDMIWQLHT